MNVNTLNSNNNIYDSVVTPPRMNDLAFWYTQDHAAADASNNLTNVYDRSGSGNHLSQATANKRPELAVVATKLAGKRVFGFDQDGDGTGVTTYIQDAAADVDKVFGTSLAPTVDPEFTCAMVVNERSGNSGSKNFFSVQENTGSNPNKYYVYKAGGGAGFRVNGDDATTDTSDKVFVVGTPKTVIGTLVDKGSSMEYRQWVGGDACDWDDEGVGEPYPCDPNTMFSGSGTNATFVTLGGTLSGATGAKCDIAEVLFWKGVHTVAERTETLNYLRDRWDCS